LASSNKSSNESEHVIHPGFTNEQRLEPPLGCLISYPYSFITLTISSK